MTPDHPETAVHPVLHIAKQVFRVEGDTWLLDSHGAQLLELAILDHANDPALVDAVRTLFGMVVLLQGELASPDAARQLTLVLGTVAPAIEHLAPGIEAVASVRAEELAARAKALLGTRSEVVEKLSGPPPAGAISVRKLDIPPLPIPGRRRPKAARR